MSKINNIFAGTIVAKNDRVTFTFSTYHGSVTVPLDVDQSICLDVVADDDHGSTIEITRCEGRGWQVSIWGTAAVLDAFLPTGQDAARVEWSTARGDRAVTVDVREPQDSLYPIRHARGMIERCAVLLSTWRDGGGPRDALLEDLRRHSYIE